MFAHLLERESEPSGPQTQRAEEALVSHHRVAGRQRHEEEEEENTVLYELSNRTTHIRRDTAIAEVQNYGVDNTNTIYNLWNLLLSVTAHSYRYVSLLLYCCIASRRRRRRRADVRAQAVASMPASARTFGYFCTRVPVGY